MSVRRSRSSLRPAKVFLLSGFPGEQRKELGKKITLLGGKYFQVEDFKAHCTHVICGKLTRSEKFLGACATGKWVLHPDYITQSVVAKDWLDEEQFEWCDENITRMTAGGIPNDLAFASRRWRFMLGDQNGAFAGWKVAVVVGANRSKALKRLLISGGAEVFNMKIPIKNPEKVANTIGYIFVSEQNVTAVAQLLEYGVLCIRPEFIGDYLIKAHIFVSEQNVTTVAHLLEYGVLCIRPEFIGDCLIKDPAPDPMDYLVQITDIQEPGHNSSQGDIGTASFLMSSQIDCPSSQPSSVSAEDDKNILSSASQVLPEHLNHVVVKDEPTSATSGQRRSSGSVPVSSKTVSDASSGSSEPVVHSVSTPVKPGPSGAASQTGTPRFNHNLEIIGLKNSHPVNHSTPVSKPVIKPVTPSDITLTDNELKSGELESMIGVNSPYLRKAKDQSKVKRSKSNIEASSNDMNKGRENNFIHTIDSSYIGVSACELEQNLNVKNLIKSQSDTTAVLSQIRTSSRLQNCNSEPAWKDLIPRKRSTEKAHADGEEPANGVIKTISNNVATADNALSSSKHMSSEKSVNHQNIESENTETRQGDRNILPSQVLPEQFYHVVKDEPLSAPDCHSGQPTSSDSKSFSSELLNIKNLIPSQNDTTEELSQIRTSSRLQNCKSEPAWKDLIPKRKSSTEKTQVARVTNKLSKETICDLTNGEETAGELVETVSNNVAASVDDRLSSNNPVSSDTSVSHLTVKSENKEIKSSAKCVVDVNKTARSEEIRKVSTSEQDFNEVSSQWNNRIPENRIPEINISSTPAIKKKRSRQDADLQSILREVKRQKVSQCEWRPTVFALDPPEVQNDSSMMPMTLTEIIHSSLEEKLSKQTAILDDLSSKVSKKYTPQPKTLHAIMVNLLLGARTDLEANRAYLVLKKILHLHPPTSPAVQEVYRNSLCLVDSSGMDEGETAQGADWILLKECISNVISDCLGSDSTGSQTGRNSELLLKYLTCLIEQDLQHLIVHHHHIQEMWCRPLLLRLLWSPSYHVVLNSRCRELLDMMTEVLIFLRTDVAKEQRDKLLYITRTIVWFVAMATECSRLSEGGSPDGLAALQCENTLAFVHEISRRITAADVTDPTILQVIFSALQLPWQCVGVSQQLLNNMDDYLLADEQVRDLNKVTLSDIVSRYFFLLPKFNMSTEHATRYQDSPAKRQRSFINSKKKECLGESKTDSTENIARLSGKINKKNSKGETAVHTACIRNDVNKLKQLLKTPGVDVNIKDNAGWTPLHEACNHGNIQCVQELLKFVPAKTMEHYFRKDCTVLRKVDLLAGTGEGITPLHDAVLNNKLEVCRMLLQHGGHKLLSAVTCLNYTPLQLAETEEMYSLLSSYLPAPRRLSDSQEFSFSQDSMMSVDETRTELPPDHLYKEVTVNGNTRIFADKHALFTYIYLITCLLKNYLKAIDAEIIRDKIKDKIKSAGTAFKIRQRFISDVYSQNRESSQEMDGHLSSSQDRQFCGSEESEPLSQTDNISYTYVGSGEYSDKENKRLAFGEKNSVVNDDTGAKTLSDIKIEPFENKVNKAYVKAVKRDLKVLRGLQRHVDMFKSHLDKICAKDDTRLIETELLEISVLVDNFVS